MVQRYLMKSVCIVVLVITLVFPLTISMVFAQDVEIVSHSGFVDTIGYYRVVGEVENIGSSSLEDIEITATFYNESHVEVTTVSTHTALLVLLPGRKSPFGLVLVDIDQSAKVDHYSLTVSDYSIFSGSRPLNLQIVSNSSSIILDYYVIEGEIKNTGDTTTTFVTVFATFYNSTGHVVAIAGDYANPHTIDAGNTSQFEIVQDWSQRNPLISEYTLTAESEEYAIVPEFPFLLIPLMAMPMVAIAALFLRKKAHAIKP